MRHSVATTGWHGNRSLTPDDLRLASSLRKDGLTFREIGEKFEVHTSTIYAALTRKTYREVRL